MFLYLWYCLLSIVQRAILVCRLGIHGCWAHVSEGQPDTTRNHFWLQQWLLVLAWVIPRHGEAIHGCFNTSEHFPDGTGNHWHELEVASGCVQEAFSVGWEAKSLGRGSRLDLQVNNCGSVLSSPPPTPQILVFGGSPGMAPSQISRTHAILSLVD